MQCTASTCLMAPWSWFHGRMEKPQSGIAQVRAERSACCPLVRACPRLLSCGGVEEELSHFLLTIMRLNHYHDYWQLLGTIILSPTSQMVPGDEYQGTVNLPGCTQTFRLSVKCSSLA